MDTLVTQYSGRPQFQNEGHDQLEEQELYGQTPGLSLKFAMPPVAQVGLPGLIPECSSPPKMDGNKGCWDL